MARIQCNNSVSRSTLDQTRIVSIAAPDELATTGIGMVLMINQFGMIFIFIQSGRNVEEF